MKLIRRNAKPVCIFLTFMMLSITIPYQSVLAAMVGTEATLDLTRSQQARHDINNLLLREDVQNALMAQGINPLEAKARIDGLSDAEVVRLADQIDKLPTGGDGPNALIIIPILVIFLLGFLIGYLATYSSKKSASSDSEKSDSPQQYQKPAGGPDFNPEEPWTREWKVEGSRWLDSTWVMKQSGRIVKTTKDSNYKFEGKVRGNQLKGKYKEDYAFYYNIALNISSDGQSFEGTWTSEFQGRTGRMKGKRVK